MMQWSFWINLVFGLICHCCGWSATAGSVVNVLFCHS